MWETEVITFFHHALIATLIQKVIHRDQRGWSGTDRIPESGLHRRRRRMALRQRDQNRQAGLCHSQWPENQNLLGRHHPERKAAEAAENPEYLR